MPKSYTIVLTTLPTLAKSRQISGLLLRKKLAACVNIVGPVQSSFWWQGKIDHAHEYLLLIKTHSSYFRRLREYLEKNHPYSIPEIVALPIQQGNPSYLNWIRRSMK